MSLTIRPAQSEDAPLIHAFIVELAEYERAAHEVVASVEDIRHSLFGEGARAQALICERDGEALGPVDASFASRVVARNGLRLGAG